MSGCHWAIRGTMTQCKAAQLAPNKNHAATTKPSAMRAIQAKVLREWVGEVNTIF
jgi:hypothetical protein